VLRLSRWARGGFRRSASDTAHCAFSAGSAAATRDKYAALLRRLRTDPASADISYADLASKIVAALYGTAVWPKAAECLQDVWTTGRFCPPASPSAPPIPGAPPADVDQAAGGGPKYAGPEQALAIFCSESPNPRPSAFRALDGFANQRSGAAGRYWSWGSEPCASWPASAANRYAGPWNRRTANPVLVIGNTHDPAAPYRGARAMARLLARARLLTVDGYGHTSLTTQAPARTAMRAATSLPRPCRLRGLGAGRTYGRSTADTTAKSYATITARSQLGSIHPGVQAQFELVSALTRLLRQRVRHRPSDTPAAVRPDHDQTHAAVEERSQ
jgi:TAP-like protein